MGMTAWSGTARRGLLLATLAAVLLVGGCARHKPKIKVKLPEPEPLPERVEAPRPATLLAIARLLVRQGRTTESAALFARVIREAPQYTEAYSDLAALQTSQRRPGEALETLRQGLRQAPRDPVLLNNAGICCLLVRDYAGAAGYFEQARAARPGEARYTANLAMALALAGRDQEALRLYEQILPPEAARRNLEILRRTRAEKSAPPPAAGG